MNKATKIIVTIGIVIAFMVITVALQLFAEEGVVDALMFL